jgi:hypothetical protein
MNEQTKPKRKPGRPVGSVRVSERKKTHGITISEEAWRLAVSKGNASLYIERLILADKAL